jgi:hypothetical protein
MTSGHSPFSVIADFIPPESRFSGLYPFSTHTISFEHGHRRGLMALRNLRQI